MIYKLLLTSIFVFVLGYGNTYCQTLQQLKQEIQKSLSDDYSEKDLQNFISLTYELEATSIHYMSNMIDAMLQATDTLDTKELERIKDMKKTYIDSIANSPNYYDFFSFSKEDVYINAIPKLLSSTNIYQRTIAYILIGALKDTNYSSIVVSNLPNETEGYPGIWNAIAVSQVAPKATTPLFDYIVKYEDYGDAHIVPFLFAMDTASLIKTSHSRINEPTIKAKILALQIMAIFDKTPITKMYILNALNTFDVDTKGYAISALGMYQKEKLLQYLKPYANIEKLKNVIIYTLKESNSQEDREYASRMEKE